MVILVLPIIFEFRHYKFVSRILVDVEEGLYNSINMQDHLVFDLANYKRT